jgi:hypothetical protein
MEDLGLLKIKRQHRRTNQIWLTLPDLPDLPFSPPPPDPREEA